MRLCLSSLLLAAFWPVCKWCSPGSFWSAKKEKLRATEAGCQIMWQSKTFLVHWNKRTAILDTHIFGMWFAHVFDTAAFPLRRKKKWTQLKFHCPHAQSITLLPHLTERSFQICSLDQQWHTADSVKVSDTHPHSSVSHLAVLGCSLSSDGGQCGFLGMTHYLFHSDSLGFPSTARAGCVSHADKIMTHCINKFLISALRWLKWAATWMVLPASSPRPDLFLSTQLSADKSYCRKPPPAPFSCWKRFFQEHPSAVGWSADSVLVNDGPQWRVAVVWKKKGNCIYAIRSLIVGQFNLGFLAIKVFLYFFKYPES